ncbi:SMI1/KNR4 family protein [Winogradskyella sp.]|uniref:SMI1/KNR4 family protein n=1 Tax=Winogradskyella sp. TaxID=1883156 RepID=UPI002637A16B|nr:SMI1/KNR4 family protein [Winogradskyella sp.]
MINFNLTKEKIKSEDLIAFEQELELSLPETYKAHMLQFNGGAPEKEYFKGVSVAHFNPIKNGRRTLEDVIKSLKDILPINYLPFAYDPGGNQICMDLNDGENYGKVYYVPMDMGDTNPEFLADSFTEFVNGLSLENSY